MTSGPASAAGGAAAGHDQVAARVKPNWKMRAIIAMAIAVIRMLSLTWRLKKINPGELADFRARGVPVVFAFWHGHMLPLIHAHRDENITVLVSEHKDGEMIARVAGAFGFPSIRGSTSRSAVRSLLALVKLIKGGRDVGVTPDGPRGPARSFAPGVVLAAQRSGAPLIAIAAHASRAWHLRTWDNFVIPKPFATISVAYGSARWPGGETRLEESVREYQQLLENTCVLAGERP